MNSENSTENSAPQPGDRITVNQIVAWNVAHYRRSGGFTQKELGGRLGWTGAKVSEAERAWDGKRSRQFDAQELAALSMALGVPLIALFLPPDGGDYVISGPDVDAWEGQADYGMGDLLELVVMPDSDDESTPLEDYRHRLRTAVGTYLDERWQKEVARWLEPADDLAARRDRAATFRSLQAEAERGAAYWGGLADAIDPDTESKP